MPDFVHLHVHSHFSLLTGLPKIKELVKAAKERGFKALALTDYGSMYGMIQFYEKCREEEIKPLLGCELYLAQGSRFDKRAKIDMSAFHLVLLAETFEGYQNIMRMSSIGHLEGFYYRPRIDKEVLRHYAKGTIALSGCMGGEIPQLIHNGASSEKINATIKEYQDIFGVDNFFLELEDHPEKEGQVEVNNALIKASKETGASLVVTRDVHYLNPDDAEAQDVLTCIKDGKTLDQPGRFSMRHIDRSLNTGDDIASRFQHIPSALENTVKIAERCNVEVPLDLWHFPDVKLPEGKTAEVVLKEMVTEGLTRRYSETNETLSTRAEYELEIINQRGFAPYFLAVADYLAWSKANGIITTTRGSAAGSIVSYCIGITSVDPIRFKLPFERFLNPFRPSPPDVDGDFADYRRDEVIKYVTEKYGNDKVAQICTFGTMAARASIRDVGRALGYSYGMVDKIAKLVPMGSQGFPMTISRALELAPEFADAYKKSDEVKRMIHLAQKIEGCARHISVHAAGVVIAPEPLTNFTPLQREPGGDKIITQYEMKSVEKAGILKMDFLGLRNLSILEEALRYIKKTRDIDIVIEEIPYDDTQTFEMLGRGETVGVFQLGGSGMTHYLKELRPTVIDDIMAMVALYRPGPMESIPEYIARKNDPSLITFPDERLRDVLSASYGVLTYQDDVLLTSIELAGYTWGEADKLRKAMGKKIPAEMAKQKEKFIQGVIDNGATKSKAEEVWKLIEPFAAYGFNKAHACSYGMVAYHTAYVKAHYPGEYMAALLSCEYGDLDTVAQYVVESRKMGIPVLPPDVNESFKLFGVIDATTTPRIRFGLGAVKNVGEHIAEVIIETRKNGGAFKNLEDFIIRVRDKDLNKKSLESLIKAGALDAFGDRSVLLGNIENLLNFSREVGEIIKAQQFSLFGGGGYEDMRVRLDPVTPMEEAERLQWEKELLGLYISKHPCSLIAHELDDRVKTIAVIHKEANTETEKWVCVVGVVGTIKKFVTKKGDMMAFAVLEDATGALEIVLFPRTYDDCNAVLVDGAMLAVLGKRDAKDGEVKLLAERVEKITPGFVRETINHLYAPQGEEVEINATPETSNEPVLVTPALVISVTPDRVEKLETLRSHLNERPGPYNVYVCIVGGKGKKLIATGICTSISPELIDTITSLVGIENIVMKE